MRVRSGHEKWRPAQQIGRECLQKLRGVKGSEVDKDVNSRFSDSSSEPAVEILESRSTPRKKETPPSHALRIQRNHHRRVLKFTSDEDDYLKEGIRRYGIGQWTFFLRDPDFTFQDGRVADSLKKRAEFTLSSDGIRDREGKISPV